jgi:hypothetical protein
MPQSLTDADIRKALPEIDWIADSGLRSKVIAIWIEMAAQMSWASLHDVPKNIGDEKNRTLMGHVRGVTQMAVAICDIARNLHGKSYDRDLMIAACLLHDVSKLVEYEPAQPKRGDRENPKPGRKSRLGKNIQHAVYATHRILSHGLPLELANLVITHTHESNIRGTTWEAAVLFYADFADSDVGVSDAGARLYSERWGLPRH